MILTLSRGEQVQVDDKDYESLNQFKWHMNHYGYAVRKIHLGKIDGKYRQKCVFMHREIMDTPRGMDTDHINGDKLDNRKLNLRVCKHSDNSCNNKLRVDNKSGFKGVFWSKQSMKWQVRVIKNGKHIHLGLYTNRLDAARAYNQGAIKYFGEFAHLNYRRGITL